VEPSIFGTTNIDWAFMPSLISIIIINLILSGDNAVVIAMAVRILPKQQRTKGIIYGSAGAVLFRVVFTFFIAELLVMSYVKLIGGIVILWIAIKLFTEDEEVIEGRKQAATLWHAVRIIFIADVTMALDNMLAVGAASHGNFFLLLFGLGLSIPLVIFTSSLLSKLIDRFSIIVYLGAAVLGKIGGEMIMTDHIIDRILQPNDTLIYTVEAFWAVGVIIIGRLLLARDVLKKA
jgi:YjbE family integral membrane protein